MEPKERLDKKCTFDVRRLGLSRSFNPYSQSRLPAPEVVTRKIQWLCGTIFSCASQRRLDQVSWDLTSAGARGDAARRGERVPWTSRESEEGLGAGAAEAKMRT